MSAGGVAPGAPSIPTAAARQALLDAYQVGFSITLNHLMDIGAVVALVGAVCGFALVRQRDFVVPTGAPSGPPGAGAGSGGASAPDAAVPAVHA